MNSDLEKYLKKNSSRHHYIPQFLISGFINSEGDVFVYDKQKDVVQNKSRPPKAIFFEWDRNTIILPDKTESSILEDLLFKDIDDIGSEVVKYFQNTNLEEIQFTDENIAQFLFFLICLFWRIPKTDFAVNQLVKSADIKMKGIDSEILKKSEAFQKAQRSGIIIHTIKEIISNQESFKKFVNIHQIPKDILVIGDNPLLYRKSSLEFSSFGKEDFLMAITSNRIFSSTKDNLDTLTMINAVAYNAAVIHQSVRYICCGNLDVLKKSVDTYKTICKKGVTYGVEEVPFIV